MSHTLESPGCFKNHRCLGTTPEIQLAWGVWAWLGRGEGAGQSSPDDSNVWERSIDVDGLEIEVNVSVDKSATFHGCSVSLK